MLSRAHVVGSFLALYPDATDLEVGVNQGETFLAVSAAKKVAVDPNFTFDTVSVTAPGMEFHPIRSDTYFASRSAALDRFDVIFLDGLHTFEQTLRDLMNAVANLAAGGVIVIDDVIPNSFDASLPDLEQVHTLRQISARTGVPWPSDGSWMGDVFKLVFFIDTFMQQYSFATVQENHGQCIFWYQLRPANTILQRSMEQICRLDYRDTLLNRHTFNILPLDQIVAQVAKARDLQPGLSKS